MSHIDAMYRFQETFPIGSFHFLIEHDINIAFQKKIFVFLHIIDDSMYYSERICQLTFLIFYNFHWHRSTKFCPNANNQLSKLIDHAILLENDQKLVYIILYNSVNKQLFQKCSVYIVNVYYVKHQLRVFRLEILCSKHFLTTLINILNTK